MDVSKPEYEGAFRRMFSTLDGDKIKVRVSQVSSDSLSVGVERGQILGADKAILDKQATISAYDWQPATTYFQCLKDSARLLAVAQA